MSWQIFSSSVTLLILYQSNIDKKGIDEISLKMTSPFDFVIYLIIPLRFKRNSIYDIKHRGLFLECLPIFVQCFDYFLSIKVWYLFNYLTNCRYNKKDRHNANFVSSFYALNQSSNRVPFYYCSVHPFWGKKIFVKHRASDNIKVVLRL